MGNYFYLCGVYQQIITVEIFIGNMDAKADSKGRVFIPAAFRRILLATGDTHLILRPDIFQNCLVLHPLKGWLDELADLRSRLNKWNEKEQNTFRAFQLNREEVEMDANGRILIPKRYLQLANIKSDVRFIGVDRTIEIWNKEELEKSALSPDEFRKNVSELLGQ